MYGQILDTRPSLSSLLQARKYRGICFLASGLFKLSSLVLGAFATRLGINGRGTIITTTDYVLPISLNTHIYTEEDNSSQPTNCKCCTYYD